MHKFMKVFKSIEESNAASSLPPVPCIADGKMIPIDESINSELVRLDLGFDEAYRYAG